jgi:hypothetical protein
METIGQVKLSEKHSELVSSNEAVWQKRVSNLCLAACGLSLLLLLCVSLTGCGTGGYAGGAFNGVSASAATIDAAQTFPITASVAGTVTVSWKLQGTNCAVEPGCGSLSAATGNQIQYIAPKSLSTQIQVAVIASAPGATKTTAITVNPDPTLTTNPPSGVVGQSYSTTVTAAGGTAPLMLSLTGGSLPAGLSFNATTGVISGTPTTAGQSTAVFSVVDSSNTPFTVTAQAGIAVVTAQGAAIAISGNPPAGTVNAAYAAQLSASGGTAPYTWTLVSGALPAGLTLSAGGAITGTPTAQGTSGFTVQAKDAVGTTATGAFSITISAAGTPLSLGTGTLPSGTVGVAYSATIPVSGGASPYSCVITSGTLPSGLALDAGCLVSGTPTVAGTVTVQVKATDSSSPQETANGPETITIAPAALSLTTGTLPSGTVGVAYSAPIPVAGGTSPYTCVLASGNLPAGLSLGTGCVVSGTPTAAGTLTVQVQVTDASSPQKTITGPETITINPAALSLTTGTLPAGTVGTAYSATIPVAGGTSPYQCTIITGTLPAGLALGANCLVSGTPTTAGTITVQVNATDSSSPQKSVSGPQTITINPAAATLVIASPPSATVGQPYTGTIPVTGGTGPYTCILKSGSLPQGLSLGSTCVVTGTPTMSGSATVTVTATDSSSPKNSTTGPVTLTVNPGATLTIGNPPPATVGQPYMGTIPVTGGAPPYMCVTTSVLPQGLALSAACVITGTPVTSGPTTISVTVTDSGNPPISTTGPVVITVNAAAPLTFMGSLPDATVGVAYTQTLAAQGGTAPYTYALTAGTLPAGITLSTTGVVSGTPTTPGASSFTVTATDSSNPRQTAALPLVLLVLYAQGTNDAELNGPYAFVFQGYDDVAVGVLAYQTATVGSITADGAGAITTGEQDSNHQASAPTGNTVSTQGLLGTYTLGADHRGLLTLTTLKSDGTVDRTTTYAISVKAPVAPATTTASGSLIEYDGGNLVGTRGSGSLLQQTAGSSISGSYAFGLSGDTPCLPACTVGVLAGPVASVGVFTTDGAGNVGGLSDANIATNHLASEALSGAYTGADNDGRVQLTMSTANTLNGVYPQDYAVYVVDANRAFVMSTDKHSTYILLAGSAQKQAVSTFSSTNMNGAFVGYENAPTNPGPLGATLQSVLNLSTATLFEGSDDGAGNCTTNDVDQGGVAGLVNGLTGLGSGSKVINALLGTYASTGSSSCAVTANGRVVFNYPAPNTLLSGTLALLGLSGNPPAPRVVYLSSTNAGYFLETGYAGLGRLEQQTGAPFTVATLQGTFVYGSAPAASIASTNASGVFTADGAGHATTTLDENVGVGNLNLLQLGVTTNFTYTLTDATAGRFALNGTADVVYAISPSRFVLLDTNATTTSPSVAVLY